MTSFNYDEYYKNLGDSVNKTMDKYLTPDPNFPELLNEVIRYSVFAGGKRLRPVLLLATLEAFGIESTPLLPAAAALEFLHTYSLIHDDLPAMDNDDYRRGKLTSHKRFGEAAAILAGDGLLALAFRAIVDCLIEPDLLILMIKELAEASGVRGMVAGQMADMYYEHKTVTPDMLEFIHEHKTAAMIAAPLRMGAIAASASDESIALLTEFGYSIGLAFQVMDDLLDVIGNDQELGKRSRVDEERGKATYVSVYGIEESKKLVDKQTAHAISLIQHVKELEHPEYLIGIAKYLSKRSQ
ncbi:polyprenyl synthetase family protein [Sulfoacidibacillus ferrooxidans]|uniref:Farnesyl diphosphate synthase n=1 Tax=Sulfoacidibacillus ferrooxidans TaxID=2005001 RepID=A0A9X1V7J8_9BACL|nr:farnesyl diphosphate synthase [Sulfoacidibacillus ferrooxidans]MCI0183136.1 Farnesyl diphosphate synthase [Sulfoacidibacillus ferrooxidans]